MKEPMCPYCNVDLEFVDSPDGDFSSDTFYCNVYGECPQCKKVYSWVDVYKYSHFEDLEEVKN